MLATKNSFISRVRNSGDIRLVLHNPDRVGLWFYELTGRLPNGKAYLVCYRLHDGNPMNGPIKTPDIIADWSDCVVAEGSSGTILAFDSYYLSAEGRQTLQEKRVAAICSIESEQSVFKAPQLCQATC